MRPRLQHRRSFEALWGEGRTFLHPKTFVMHRKNGDGAANTSDLLLLLALFGDICL